MALVPFAVLGLFAIGQFALWAALTNHVLMQMPHSRAKDPVIALLGLAMVPGVLGVILWRWDSAAVQSAFHLRPAGGAAWALTALLGAHAAVLSLALAISLRRWLAPAAVAALRQRTERRLAEPGRRRRWLEDTTRAMHVTEIGIELARLPAGLEGFRIVHLSDLHHEFAQEVALHAAELAAESECDLVLVTGDFVVHRVTPGLENVLAALGRSRAALGVWGILGNHDIWHDRDAVEHALDRHGLRRITNRAEDLVTPGGRVRLIGVEHPWRRVEDWPGLIGAGEALRIVLSHTPDNFRRLARLGVDLVLAGHTHGGQWRLPFIGSLVVPSRHGRGYDQGVFERDGAVLHVSRGVGSVGIPLRINCPPEITRVTLHRPGG